MKEIRILLAEDDENLGSLLKEYLKAKGFHCDWYLNGEEAYAGFFRQQYDICVVDVMMPIKDGFTLVKEIREVNSEIPVIFLTAKSLKEDVLHGFALGADDYIAKPFSMEEMIFRINAILRRIDKTSEKPSNSIFQIGAYHFNAKTQMLGRDGNEIKLTTKESELLRLLCEHVNDVLERNYALKTIWVDDSYFNARSMDVYITKLRKYLKEDDSIQIINVHGKGFKLVVN